MSETGRMRTPDGEAAAEGRPWDRYLVVFMRIVAALWIAKGLAAWAAILSPGLLRLPPFGSLPPAFAAGFIAFAVLDLVAAVGLWLTSTWGGVMWLLAVMAHLVVTALGPAIPGGRVIAGIEVALVLAYVVLSWLASREN